jgi:enoyl-CoA hydratase/carnithine racemase
MGATQPTASPLVSEERAGAVATIRLNRPEKLNALNTQLAHELVHALLNVQGDKEIRCVVVTGAGRAFCAGGDLELLRDARKRKATDEVEELVLAGKEIAVAIATMPKIVIAAVNGPAAGGGMNLALAADIRIASWRVLRNLSRKLGYSRILAGHISCHELSAQRGPPNCSTRPRCSRRRTRCA